MPLIEPGLCSVDVEKGELRGATNRYAKTLADLADIYQDQHAYETLLAKSGNTVVYEVTDYKPSQNPGDMIIGVTRMLPGKVGDEYFLTRGHIHAKPNRPEMYYGEKGHGLMLLESPSGDVRIVEMAARTMCYVPPYWIHRSINVGTGELVMTFAYPADSGQDYDIIAKAGGMRQRIVDNGNGGWKAIDNTGYRPRAQAVVNAILAKTA